MAADIECRLQRRFCQLSDHCSIDPNKVKAPYSTPQRVGVHEMASISQRILDIGGGERINRGMGNHWLVDLESDGGDTILTQQALSATRNHEARRARQTILTINKVFVSYSPGSISEGQIPRASAWRRSLMSAGRIGCLLHSTLSGHSHSQDSERQQWDLMMKLRARVG